MKLDISDKEVLRATSHPLNLKKKDIEYLQSIALSNITGKSRICLHKNIEEKLHEMFIFHKKDYYVRPHRHFNKSESILILEGSADLVLFDEKGDIQNVIHLENFSSGNKFTMFFALSNKSDCFVFSKSLVLKLACFFPL